MMPHYNFSGWSQRMHYIYHVYEGAVLCQKSASLLGYGSRVYVRKYRTRQLLIRWCYIHGLFSVPQGIRDRREVYPPRFRLFSFPLFSIAIEFLNSNELSFCPLGLKSESEDTVEEKHEQAELCSTWNCPPTTTSWKFSEIENLTLRDIACKSSSVSHFPIIWTTEMGQTVW